jgi:hypothetical protein
MAMKFLGFQNIFLLKNYLDVMTNILSARKILANILRGDDGGVHVRLWCACSNPTHYRRISVSMLHFVQFLALRGPVVDLLPRSAQMKSASEHCNFTRALVRGYVRIV